MTAPRWPSDAAVEAALHVWYYTPHATSVHDQMRAALIAADRAAWQPIETAPRSGEVVLLWAPDFDRPRTGWTYANDPWQDIRDSNAEPTHWRPLPAPPAQGDGE
jgi:hypothetical protein